MGMKKKEEIDGFMEWLTRKGVFLAQHGEKGTSDYDEIHYADQSDLVEEYKKLNETTTCPTCEAGPDNCGGCP